MYKVKILVVCGSGVATSMHAAYKLQQYFDEEKISCISMVQEIMNWKAAPLPMTSS